MREENRSEIIHDALNLLDDEMIEEVDRLRGGIVDVAPSTPIDNVNTTQESSIQREFRPWRKWAALAASVCVLIIVGTLWNGSLSKVKFDQADGNLSTGDAQKENLLDVEEDILDVNDMNVFVPENNKGEVMIPPLKIELGRDDGSKIEYIGFFIYEGRCYVQTCEYMTKEVVGEYVCSTKALVHEWSKEDEYVELTGSINAKFYEVRGVNPQFMLCTVYENGVVETFVHNNGITLNKGWELLEDRLGLVIDGTGKYDKFLTAFGEADFLYRKDIPIKTQAEDILHLYIQTEEGVPLHFELLGEGYVSYYGLNQVCVKIDERIYNEVVAGLNEK